MSKKSPPSVLLENRKARFLYFLSDFITAGIVLTGTEIKSLRARNASLSDSYIYVKNREAFIANMHISPYKDGTIYNVDSLRDRKLLLTKHEIDKLAQALAQGGYTCVPVKVFLAHGLAKVEIALAKGKHNYDKREAIKERDTKRAISKAMRAGARGNED